MSDYTYSYTSPKGNTHLLGKAEAARRAGGRLALRRLILDARRQRSATGTAITGGTVTVKLRPGA